MSREGLQEGDYVLATKFYDADPGDPWVVGFLRGIVNGRFYVEDGHGSLIYPAGMRTCARIPLDVGKWLIEQGKALECSPPGSVNLWKMLGMEPNRS